eukprot:Skav206434  [mRNA]  locus=scaffold295:58678:59037:+ [translate_table: standard]
MTSQRKREISDGLYLEDNRRPRCRLKCCARCFGLYAMAGCSSVAGAPEAFQASGLGADAAKFLAAPLGVVRRYFFRAKQSAASLPAAQRMAWLQAPDVEERSRWVSKFWDSAALDSYKL